MIVLTKNATTIFAVTLWEKTTLTNPIYLLEFINNLSKVKYYCIMADTSPNIPRYNKFTFIEGVDDPTNGSLILGQGGFYNYTAYEQLSASNLNPTGLTIVESGKMKLLDTAEEPDFTQHSVLPTTNIVYNPS